MRIASWNVNSIKARLVHVQRWLGTNPVDVLLLQEIKTENGGFPAQAMADLGFAHQLVIGEKSYNGVAFLSRHPITDAVMRLPGDAGDAQARFVGGTVKNIRIYNLYAPNGNPIGTEKFAYKLSWLQRLYDFMAAEFVRGGPAVFAGDYNIIPTTVDAKTPAEWKDDALMQREAQRTFAALCHIGYADAYRIHHTHTTEYTFFDYRAAAWQRNNGIRIDHMLLSPESADRLARCWIDSAPETSPRGWETPSDHAPITIDLKDTP